MLKNYNNSKFISNTLVSRRDRLCPAGTVESFAGLNPPSGWLLCDGTAVSRTTYPVLFAAIGVIHGAGDGATTFNLPDMRGKVSVAAGQGIINGVLLTNRILGDKDGEEKHTLTVNEIPAHTHTYDKSNSVQNINAPDAAGITAANETTTAVNSGSTGGGLAHNVMQPFLVLNHIIKF